MSVEHNSSCCCIGCEAERGTRRWAGHSPFNTPFERISTFENVVRELERAYGKHGRAQWGRHEFYAILLEEVDELWDAIKADKPQKDVRSEAIQIAAMVFRYLETGDRYRNINKKGNS